MARVLYVSYTGLLDPLGQSQVLQYVLGLARDHRITLLTFEKPDALANEPELDALAERCRVAGIDWHRLTYHNRPGIPATIYDIVLGIRKATALARTGHIQIVHTRSYIAGLIGLAVKRRTGARFIFDMRGFWPDERVDGGIWKPNWLRYRAFKWVERRLFLGADHVVSLTRAGAREIEKFDYLQGIAPPMSVIPTCTNLELFRPVEPVESPQGSFTLGYVGSAGSWYMFAEVAQAVRMLFDMRPDARFLVINKGDHDAIRNWLSEAGVDLERVEIRAAPYSEVSEQIARMDAGIFFIKQVWSKRASSPTRLGEFLACGKPVLANGQVGDVEETIVETDTGVAINAFDEQTQRDALVDLIERTKEPGLAARCRQAAEEHFALETGILDYSKVYRNLAGTENEVSVRGTA
ncbi:glycosyltransferase family 4 protein [Roseovarius sp. A21]|uniref:Glycosyltransferase family 4 protein n=1 Tax=Roseovarius bejariae TaxID=2576383 RepID=A0A844D370_9RHOB|nr:glycosyltransferase family 4 protein [Roseovarius bejariae]MRU15688.1 glycosyltransferase family 4 protein [Roseovarius bejariae]